MNRLSRARSMWISFGRSGAPCGPAGRRGPVLLRRPPDRRDRGHPGQLRRRREDVASASAWQTRRAPGRGGGRRCPSTVGYGRVSKVLHVVDPDLRATLPTRSIGGSDARDGSERGESNRPHRLCSVLVAVVASQVLGDIRGEQPATSRPLLQPAAYTAIARDLQGNDRAPQLRSPHRRHGRELVARPAQRRGSRVFGAARITFPTSPASFELQVPVSRRTRSRRVM